MTLVRKLWAIGFAAVIVACASSPGSAQTAKWDQAKVAALAQQVQTASNTWWQALRDEGDDQDFVGSGDSQTYDSMTRESRTLNEAAQGLAGNLAGGKNRADTLDMYKSMKEMMDDMKVDQSLTFLEDQSIAAWKNFASVFKQLGAYYEPLN